MVQWLMMLAACAPLWAAAGVLERARDAQDRAALEAEVARCEQEVAQRPGDAAALFRLGLARSYLSMVAFELQDKAGAAAAAQAGIDAARKAVSLAPENPEYHWLLGALCGQIIPANVRSAFRYGRCAQEELERAIALRPGYALAWLSRGVGKFYLPEALGGGVEAALTDIEKALSLDATLAEAWLWKGIVLRKAGRMAEARAALEQSLARNPHRRWARQQLEKTPQP